MNKVCGNCGSTEVIVHEDVKMATCRECGFAGAVSYFDDINIAYWLSGDTHALAELFVVRQFNSLYGIVEDVEPVSWYSILIPDKTFKSRQDAVSESVNVLRREASHCDFINLWKKCESTTLRQKARGRMKKRQYFRPKKKVKLSKHWCVNCDAALTSGYSRCPNCGFVEVNHRIRDIKKTMSEVEDE